MNATIPGLRIVQEETVNKFQGQHLVEFGRVVAIPFNVTAYYSLEAFAFDIGSGESSARRATFPECIRRGHPGTIRGNGRACVVPEKDCSSRNGEKAWSSRASHCGMPMSYAYSALNWNSRSRREVAPEDPSPISRQATVRWDSEQSSVSIGNQPQGNLVAGEG